MTAVELINIICIHAFSLIILLLIAVNLKKCVEMDSNMFRLLRLMILSTMAVIICNSAAWMSTLRNGETALFIHFISLSLYIFLSPLPTVLWYIVAVYMTQNQKIFTVPRIIVLATVYFATAWLVVTNSYTGSLFRLNAKNVFQPGCYLAAIYVFCLFFLLLATMRIYAHHNDHSFDLVAAQYFWLPPLVGGVLQACIPQSNTFFAGITIAVLILYIGLQTKSNRLDYLTGVHNRRYLDHFVNVKVRQGRFSGIIIDVDHYKLINDNFGHLIGDEVLIAIASILKVSTRKRDCVARYGGDEFLIVVDSGEMDVLYTVISRINYQIFQMNNNSEYPFNLSLSMGYDIYDPVLYKSGKEFIKHIDQLMYLNKEKKPRRLELKHAPENHADQH